MQSKIASREHGFTLIELMIAMLLGLVILGGVLTIYSSISHTNVIKTRFDSAQESIRYSHYVITRLVHNANSFAGSSSSSLVIGYPGDITQVDDCQGSSLGPSSQTRFDAENGRLRCDDEDIALSIKNAEFEYGVIDDSTGQWKQTSLANASSVKVILTVQPHADFAERKLSFIATMRNPILEKG
ncbi:PilW family protein [Marinobacterium lutimaris]|uniref:Prepilin-type N-terminal cleavage/methylation domain-containing protein n=1 Tax=Marinobacterium lutimaris TaxID=568106 RepID=A0A1H5Z910_9GAMM|nr:prepilin-type N-terminal cleavage/methylation domain-containing protein [Marinobacterium lutimaris]SEG32117.1 prepilin-type N-terminal cleavage/methylation domain-containing protein [Marinobacterium lutimaris]